MEGKTTAELQGTDGYAGIYTDWNMQRDYELYNELSLGRVVKLRNCW